MLRRLADELEAIFPTLVRANQSLELDGNSEKVDFKSVNYEELVPILIKGMQEQNELIRAQNERINQLEERIKKMDVMNPSEVTLCWFNGLVFHQDRKYLEKIRPIINSSEFWLKIILIQHFDRIVNLVNGLRRAIHDVTNCSN